MTRNRHSDALHPPSHDGQPTLPADHAAPRHAPGMPAHAAARMVQARLADDAPVATGPASPQGALHPALPGSLPGALPDYQYGVVRKQDRHAGPPDDDPTSLLPQPDQAMAGASPATPATPVAPSVTASPEGLAPLADTSGLTGALQPDASLPATTAASASKLAPGARATTSPAWPANAGDNAPDRAEG